MTQDILEQALTGLPDAPDDHPAILVVIQDTFRALTDPEYQQGVSTTVPGDRGKWQHGAGPTRPAASKGVPGTNPAERSRP